MLLEISQTEKDNALFYHLKSKIKENKNKTMNQKRKYLTLLNPGASSLGQKQ